MTPRSTWSSLLTEQRLKASARIDELTTDGIVELINTEDRKVADAVQEVLPEISKAVDLVASALHSGGRLFYLGAGTSGRLGVLDASECPPTFGVEPEMVQGIIAGGNAALVRSQEGAEDSKADGAKALEQRGVGVDDVVMGIAASGVTPFVLGGLWRASELGAASIFFTCNPESAKKVDSNVKITPRVGPEVVTGSTRMKAGTATKMVLNMITTATMIKLGKVYGNLMVDLKPSCAKLLDRAERILAETTELDPEASSEALKAAENDLKTAIVMTKRAVSLETARCLLQKHNGVVKNALSEQVSR
jgi:N-acetylmuramic acid 6-phosphate etherase